MSDETSAPQLSPEEWVEALKVDVPVTADQLRRIRYAALNAEGTDQAIRDDLVALCDTVSALRAENAELRSQLDTIRGRAKILTDGLRRMAEGKSPLPAAVSSHEARDR